MYRKLIFMVIGILAIVSCSGGADNEGNNSSDFEEGDIAVAWVPSPFIESTAYVVGTILNKENNIASMEIISSHNLTKQQKESNKYKTGAFLPVKTSLLYEKKDIASQLLGLENINNEIKKLNRSLIDYIVLNKFNSSYQDQGWPDTLLSISKMLEKALIPNREHEDIAVYLRATANYKLFWLKVKNMDSKALEKMDKDQWTADSILLMNKGVDSSIAIDNYIDDVLNEKEISQEHPLTLLLIGMRISEVNSFGWATYEELLVKSTCKKRNDRAACENPQRFSFLTHVFPINMTNWKRLFNLGNQPKSVFWNRYKTAKDFKKAANIYCESVTREITDILDLKNDLTNQQMMFKIQSSYPDNKLSSTARECMK